MDAAVAPRPPPGVLSEEDRRNLRRLRACVQLFRNLESRMPSSYMDAYLLVALEPEQGPTELARSLRTTQPVASRLLLELGRHARQRDNELDLVQRRPSPENLSRQCYSLTPRGHKLLARLLDALRGDS